MVLAERGVLAVSDELWNVAVRRATVIGPLADAGAVGHAVADTAAVELGVSRRQVYLMLRRWRAGEGLVSDLIPGRSSGGRGRGHLPDEVEAVVRELLRTRYLTRQKRSMAAAHRELARICCSRGWRVPSRARWPGGWQCSTRSVRPRPARVRMRRGPWFGRRHAAGGDGAVGAGADRPHRGRPGGGRRTAPVADRPAVHHGRDRRVQPLHRWPRPTSSDQDPKAPRRPRSFIASDSCYRPKHG